MKCPVCKDYDFEHPLDLEKHALTTHGSSAEKLARESLSAGRRAASEGGEAGRQIPSDGDK